METGGILKKNVILPAHLPSLMIMIGYPVFWLEMYVIRAGYGMTSPLALLIFSCVFLFVLWKYRNHMGYSFKDSLTQFYQLKRFDKICFYTGWVLAVVILILVFLASLFPPHLDQAFDVLNYHLTLPRQHLILNSFSHIRWSSADLFPLPVNYALAPYWFVTQLPNKIPQYFLIIGLFVVSIRLVRHLLGDNKILNLSIVAFAVLGSHGFGIQLGTAMLDIVLCYLLLASLDSLLSGAYVLAALEFSFFFWSKSFIPFQMCSIFALVTLIVICVRKFANMQLQLGWEKPGTFNMSEKGRRLRKFFIYFLLFSLLVGGPFVAKSIYYAGTPVYPFYPGLLKADVQNIDELTAASKEHIRARSMYGHGRSFLDFIKHFWLIAVPERNVNNAYDYPLGLPYILFIGPFIFFNLRFIKSGKLSLIGLFVFIFWITWWFGSQQARFLYVPLLLIFILVSSCDVFNTRALRVCLIFAMAFNLISIYRSNRHDFDLFFHGKSVEEMLRAKDQRLLQLNKEYIDSHQSGYVRLEFHDAAYAQFPVVVTEENLPWVMTVD